MKRFLPAVVPPYGMPLKMLTPSARVPRTLPADVSTTTLPVSAALATLRRKPACVPASSKVACLTKLRRFVMLAIQFIRSASEQGLVQAQAPKRANPGVINYLHEKPTRALRFRTFRRQHPARSRELVAAPINMRLAALVE